MGQAFGQYVKIVEDLLVKSSSKIKKSVDTNIINPVAPKSGNIGTYVSKMESGGYAGRIPGSFQFGSLKYESEAKVSKEKLKGLDETLDKISTASTKASAFKLGDKIFDFTQSLDKASKNLVMGEVKGRLDEITGINKYSPIKSMSYLDPFMNQLEAMKGTFGSEKKSKAPSFGKSPDLSEINSMFGSPVSTPSFANQSIAGLSSLFASNLAVSGLKLPFVNPNFIGSGPSPEGMGSHLLGGISPYGPQRPRQPRMAASAPYFERTAPEKYFERDFKNLRLTDLESASGIRGIQGTSKERYETSQIARGAAFRPIVGKTGNLNFAQLQDSLAASKGVAYGQTIQEQFNKTVQSSIKSGKSMEEAYKDAIVEIGKETNNRKQINSIIRRSIPINTEFEKNLAQQNVLMAEEKAARTRSLQIASVQNRAGVNLQASQNQIGSILQSGGMDALTPRQKAIYTASIRREEAQKLGFQSSNVGGNKLAKEQIDAAVANRLAEAPKFGLTPAAPSRFGKVGEFFKGNPLAASLGASMGLSFAGGALPSLFSEQQQRGGTASGMGIGIAGSALTGAGAGAGIGSFVPGGIVPGMAIGALIGGVKGAFDKLETSFEEMAETLNRVNEKVRKNLESAAEVRMAQAEITSLKSEGGSAREIEVANKKLRSALARMNVAPEIRAGMMGTQEQQREAQIQLERKSSERIDLSTMLSASKGAATATGFFGMGDKEITKSRESMASAFSSLFKDKTMEEVQKIREQVKTDPSYLRKALKGAGASETEIEESLPAQNKAAKAPWYTYMTGIPSLIGAYQEKKGSQFGDLAMGGMLDALDKAYEIARMANLSSEKTSKDAENRKSLLGKVEGYRQKEEFGRITYDANRSIFETNKQIAMSRENLSEPKKIEMQGEYLRKSISSELEMKRSSLLTGAQGSLIGLAKDKGVSGSFVKDVESISDASGINDLLEILTDPKLLESKGYGSTANKEMIDALLSTKRALEAANKTAEEQKRAVDANTKSLSDEYIRTGMRAAATESYGSAVTNLEDALKRAEARNDTPDIIRSLETALELAKVGARYQAGGSVGAFEKDILGTQLSTSRKSEITNIEAIRRLARSKNPEESSLISGDMLGGAEFREAKLKGQGGDFMGSLSGGFSSVFVKMKKDMNDLSELGASLGQSLSANLSGAFGDFVTGAKSGKDAFRSFAVSVLNDASRMFASQAIQGILGSMFGAMTGATGVGIGTAAPVGRANGGPIPFAMGGKVPAMLTGGEYYIGPKAAKSIGYDTLHRLNKYADGGMVRGGSGVKDDVPARLAPGSFIIKKSAVGKLGPDYLDSLVNGKVQHRFFGGLLMGAVMGGALGYATGGKKGAIAGAIIGGIGGGLAQNYSQTGSMFKSDAGAGMFQFSPSAASPSVGGSSQAPSGYESWEGGGANPSAVASKAPMPMWKQAAFGLGASALLGGVSSMLAPKDPKFTPMNATEISANRVRLETEQRGMTPPSGLFPWLSANPNGGSNQMGYVLPPTRRMYANGGMVDFESPALFENGGKVAPQSSRLFADNEAVDTRPSLPPIDGSKVNFQSPRIFADTGKTGFQSPRVLTNSGKPAFQSPLAFVTNEKVDPRPSIAFANRENVDFQSPRLFANGGKVDFQSPRLFANGGMATASEKMDLQSPRLFADGGIVSNAGKMNFQSPRLFANGGMVSSGGKTDFQSPRLFANGGTVSSGEEANFQSPRLFAAGGMVTSGGGMNLQPPRLFADGGMVAGAREMNFQSPRLFAGGGMVTGGGGVDFQAPRLFADGGMVDGGDSVEMAKPMTSSSGGGGSSNVNVKIEINNNGTSSASASSDKKDGQGGFGPDFAMKLQKQVQGIVQQELVNQSRSDGFFAQKNRFVQGR
jgi:hypothetical protein